MKRLICLALSLILLPSAAKADFIIDDFSTTSIVNAFIGPAAGGYTLDDDVAGTLSIAVTPQASFTGGGNAVSIAIIQPFPGGMPSVTLSYDFDDPIDLQAVGVAPGSPLVLNLFDDVVGSFELAATFRSGADSLSFDPIAIAGPGPIALNGPDLGDGAIVSQTDGIDLVFTATSFVTPMGGGIPTASFSGSSASIVAAPEPASMALAGVAVCTLGGVNRLRRRRKNSKEALAA